MSVSYMEISATELFSDMDGEVWELADELPNRISKAIEVAEEGYMGSQSDITINNLRKQQFMRYSGQIGIVNTDRVTIFQDMIEGDPELIAIGVSQQGHLEPDEISYIIEEYSKEEIGTPDELVESHTRSKSLRSIRQAYEIVMGNIEDIEASLTNLHRLLNNPQENRSDVYRTAEMVERLLHNLLSSIYTLTETVNSSLSNLEVVEVLNHHLQKYEDRISIATGLRHCIQHNHSLRVQWVARYDHGSDEYGFSIGIPLWSVNDTSLYNDSKESDAGGDKYERTEYYYGDVDGQLIDLDDLISQVSRYTENLYSEITEDLRDFSHIEPKRSLTKEVVTNVDIPSADPDMDLKIEVL